MGGPARLVINTIPGQKLNLEEVAKQVRALLGALEARYSRYQVDSIVSIINHRMVKLQ